MITIITNLACSSASGTLIGGSSVSKAGVVGNNITFDMTCNRTYTGTFAGGLDPASGALSLSGSVNGSQTCQFSNCKQDGLDIACNPPTGFDTIADPLTITSSLDKASFTGKGTLKTCPACAGDWSARK